MLTSGGDSQALNEAKRGDVKGICSKRDDVEIYGLKDGYKGLIYADFSMLTPKDFSGILTRGGTILGTSRQPFKLMRVPDKDGLDKVEAMKHTYHKLNLSYYFRRNRNAYNGKSSSGRGIECDHASEDDR